MSHLKKGTSVTCTYSTNYEGILTEGKSYVLLEDTLPEHRYHSVTSDQGRPVVVFRDRFVTTPVTLPRFEPVRHRYWENRKTNQTASVYGAVPWPSREAEYDWYVRELGWIVRDNRFNAIHNPSSLPTHATYRQALDYCNEANQPKENTP